MRKHETLGEVVGEAMSKLPNSPTPSPKAAAKVERPDLEGIAAELRETCNCNIDTSPCGAEDACRVAYRAADYIEALEARQVKLEAVVEGVKDAQPFPYHSRWMALTQALAALGEGDG